MANDSGPWTEAEETQLIQIIKAANTAIGVDPLSSEAPWDVVSTNMDHQRGPTQCRHKWYVSTSISWTEANDV